MTFIIKVHFLVPLKKFYTNVIYFKGTKSQTTTVNSEGIKYYVFVSR